jgi:hypothetical protein
MALLVLRLIPEQDPIYKVVTSYLNETRRHDFHMGVRIAGVKVLRKPNKDGPSVPSTYRITQPGHPPIMAQIWGFATLEDSTIKLDIADVAMAVDGRWWPFLQWIRIEYGTRTGDKYTLFDWWQSNGRSFRFMDLPYELRICIYEQIASPYIWPHPALNVKKINYFCPEVYSEDLHRPAGTGELFLRSPSGHRAPSPTQLPAVSKQIALEFSAFVDKHTQPHFRFPRQLRLLIDNPKFTHSLRRISIGAPNWRFFRLLGYKGALWIPFQPVQETTHISMFKDIATLEHLNFCFQTAISQSVTWDPWSRVRAYNSQNDVSCQKVFVDWFLTFALEHVRQVRKITLSGHVKDSTRRKWEAIFEEERAGVRHDMSAEIATIMALPSSDL